MSPQNLTVSQSEAQTIEIAQHYASAIKTPRLICLEGDLGAGKSVFARALIRALCSDAKMDVPSPTFTLLQTYEAPHFPIWHFDLYRLEDCEEVHALGFEDGLGQALMIVEWPDRLGYLVPQSYTQITITLDDAATNNNVRHIEIKDFG